MTSAARSSAANPKPRRSPSPGARPRESSPRLRRIASASVVFFVNTHDVRLALDVIERDEAIGQEERRVRERRIVLRRKRIALVAQFIA
jgi:hypothetical protein